MQSQSDGLGVKTARRFGRWRRPAIVLLLASVVFGPFVYSAIELVRFERADARRATFIYAAGQSLAPGILVPRIALAATLARLGYAETRAAPTSPGHFRRIAGDWELFLRGPEELSGNAQLFRLHACDDRSAGITPAAQEIAR